MKQLLLALALTLLMPPVLFGQVQAQFYVAVTGNDGNPGTLTQPFATLSGARDAVRIEKSSGMTGDIIVSILEGDYHVASTVEFDDRDSGTDGYSVVYQNHDAVGSARFVGGHALTGWQVHSGSIYKTYVGGQEFHTLFENGKRCRKARTPNLDPGTAYPMSKAGYLNAEGVNTSHTVLQYKSGDLSPSGWDLSDAQVFIWSGGKWDWFTDVIPISSIDVGARRITLSQNTRYDIYQNSYGSRYFVQGVFDLLDEAGEYHLDTTTGWLYYWPMATPIGNQTVVAPDVKRIIEIKGASETVRASNIRFEGLAFEVSDFTDWYRFAHVNGGDSGENHTYPQYDRAKELPQHRTGMFFLTNAESIAIRFCHFKNSGYSAIYMESYNQQHTVYGNWIEHMGYAGVYLDGKYPGEGDVSRYNVISNNKIHDIGEEVGHPSGVSITNSGSNEVSYSQIFNTPRYAVRITTYVDIPPGAIYSYDNVIRNVRAYAGAQDSGDTAPFYAWGISDAPPYLSNHFEQLIIDGSRAHPSVADVVPNGIFMDNDTHGQSFTNVEVTNSQGAPFRTNDSGSHQLTNVSWQAGFNQSLMDYANIGLKADFPVEYRGRGTFVPAVDGVNSFQSSDGVSAFSSTTSTTGLWHDRVGVFDVVGLPSPLSGAYQGQASTSNEVVTTITGLVPGLEYDIEIIHGVHTGPVGGLQDIDAGFTSGALTRVLEADSTLTGDSLAAGGSWFAAEQSIGTALADGNGEIDVYVDYASGAERSIYNGLTYTAISPGVAYCFGDGTGTPCPCGNENDGSLSPAGCANGQYASGARLSATGTASVSSDTLVLICEHTEHNQSGLYFQANNDLSPGNVWGDGLQCAGGQLKRLGVRFSDSNGFSNTSGFPLPISVKAGNVSAGDTRYYQCWYRNPTASACFSDFNASNGYALTWGP